MADLTFNTTVGETIRRALLVLYLNTGTSAAPVWSPVGKRVEDSSAEYDWGEESKTDIFGDVYSTLRKPTITQSFDPCELDGGDVAQLKIWNLAIKEQNAQALANLDMLMVHLYAGTSDTAAFAERYSACSVRPTGLGGAGGGSIGMPIDVTFGGKRTTGTAAVSEGEITFTPDVEA